MSWYSFLGDSRFWVFFWIVMIIGTTVSWYLTDYYDRKRLEEEE